MGRVYRDAYCAFCKSPRRVVVKKHVSASNYFYALILGLLLSVIATGELDFRFIPLAVLFLIISEMIIQIRWRLSLACHRCGFDPILYLKSATQAAEKVRQVYESKKSDPLLMANSPFPKLQKEKLMKVSFTSESMAPITKRDASISHNTNLQ